MSFSLTTPSLNMRRTAESHIFPSRIIRGVPMLAAQLHFDLRCYVRLPPLNICIVSVFQKESHTMSRNKQRAKQKKKKRVILVNAKLTSGSSAP